MKRIILSLAFALLFPSLDIQAIEQAQMKPTADQGAAIGLTVGSISVVTGAFFLTEYYFLKKEVQKIEKLPVWQQQIECESLQYANFEALKKELESAENTKLQSIGLMVGGICALTMGITSL